MNGDSVKANEERAYFLSVILTFKSYREQSLLRIEHKERCVEDLPYHHRQWLEKYKKDLEEIKKCIEKNAKLIPLVLRQASYMFENDVANDINSHSEQEVGTFSQGLDKVQSVFKQLMRDWSSLGALERKQCYHPIYEEIFSNYPEDKFDRSLIRILVPGAGLGRLAFEIASKGFYCQGNEFNLYMLIVSFFVLNLCKKVDEHEVYPWIHQYCNNLKVEDQLIRIRFPDVIPTSSAESGFSMTAGDFLEVYTHADDWHCVATCFFIDCAPNVVQYIENIYRILKPGGLWVNLGPLLYHYSDIKNEKSIEPSFQVVMEEPFDAEEFVERLAWRTLVESKNEGDENEINPALLHESFVQAIRDLNLLHERQQKKCEKLEVLVREDEATFFQEIYNLMEQNKQAMDTFQELDGKINHVATKVLHLGDQLDSVNGPRSRVVEALKLIIHLTDFVYDETDLSPIFTRPELIDEAADMIQKLYVISQDLPPKFNFARSKVERKYSDIEKTLIEEFVTAMDNENLDRMKEVATILSQFKGYSQCIDAYIDHSQVGSLSSKDVFSNFLTLSKYNHEIILKVFNNPEQVMAKFVLNIFQLKLVEYIDQKLNFKLGTYSDLQTLYELYSKTNQLSNDLSSYNMGNDKNYMKKLTTNIFNKYINDYITIELKCLKDRCSANLQRYYESKNHQKKQIQSGGFQDLRRDLQAVIGTRANINIAQIENYGGETFLSEELAIMILQDTKHAFQRCQLLSKPTDRATNATQILDRLVNSLLIEHVDYAVELGLQAVPVVEGAKNPPTLYFFSVVHRSNNIIHLVEKQFMDLLVPLVENTSKHNDCLQKKKFVLEDIERKINTGLDRCLNAISTWVKLYLQSEQKKSDFKPEYDDFDTVASPACKNVLGYVNSIIKEIKENLDGNNVVAILQELGIGLHRVIYEHMLQFQYNTAGAMVAICDLNEYRYCTKALGHLVTELFDTLNALCNLLLVKPENLQQVCTEDSLVKLDRTILHNFIQLRSDFKVQKQMILKA